MSFTRNDIRSVIASRLGDRDDLNDSIDLEIRYAQTALENRGLLPWFLVQRRYLSATTADTERMSLPTGWLREYGENVFEVLGTDGYWYGLRKLDVDRLDIEYGNATEARPEAYAISANELVLAPIPDASYSIRIRAFYAGADELTSDVTNAWLTYSPDHIIAAAGKRMAAGYLRDIDMATIFDGMLKDADAELLRRNVAMEEASAERLINEVI
jgi:hypothetical protein